MIKKSFVSFGSYALALAVLMANVVSAQISFGRIGSSNPLDLLIYSESAHIVLLFLIFFGAIFFAVKNVFKGERGIAVLIAAALSLLVIFALAQGGFLQAYFEQELAIWALIIAAIVGFSFLLKLLYEHYGKWVTAIALLIVYFGIFYIDISYFVPYSTASNILSDVRNFMISGWGIFIFIIIELVILIKPEGHTLASYLKRVKIS